MVDLQTPNHNTNVRKLKVVTINYQHVQQKVEQQLFMQMTVSM
jgi:hypothetical protein